MKPLFTIMLALVLVFASTIVIVKTTGVLSIEQIRQWLDAAQHVDPIYVSSIVVMLLFADLFIAMPTLTITILSGYFLGPLVGALSALLGLSLAGIGGYVLSYSYGDKLLKLLLKDPAKRSEAVDTFIQQGGLVILLSRAMPILPEVSACMAGISKMRFARFLLLWQCSAVPYAIIGAYAGAMSSLENPKPALFAAVGISTILWLAWFAGSKRRTRHTKN